MSFFNLLLKIINRNLTIILTLLLNAINNENVNLLNFDSNYVAPKYYDVMFGYQKNLESSLTYE